MTEPTDIDALIAELRAWTREDADAAPRNLRRLALVVTDRLELTTADLARAREVIDRIGKMAREDDSGAWNMHQPLIEKLADV